MAKAKKKIGIFGIGGFAREVFCCLLDANKEFQKSPEKHIDFFVSDKYYNAKKVLGVNVLKESEFDARKHKMLIAVGDPGLREQVVGRFPKETEYTSVIHPAAVISKWVELGEGAIVTAGVVLTCEIKVGKHAHFNLHTTVGHDCIIGDYFTSAPAANISGNCTLGNNVYLGSNCVLREKVTITDNVTIGMGAVVTKDIIQSGVYVGVPAQKIK